MSAVDVQDDRYLTLAEVCDIMKRGKTWIYARVARGPAQSGYGAAGCRGSPTSPGTAHSAA